MAHVYNSQLVRFLQSIERLNYSADFASEDAFTLYHQIQQADHSPASDGIGLPALGHALAGSAGTAISHILLYPLDFVITRLQVQRQLRGPSEAPSAGSEADVEYKDLLDGVQKIYAKEGGVKAFYAGCVTDTSKSMLDAFLFFLAYTALRQRELRKLGAKNLPVFRELGVGIAAGALSRLVTTPIQQIVTRKQTAALVAARDPTSSIPPEHIGSLSLKDIALQIRSERGIRGFWAGYSASVILTLNPALTFFLHNLLKRTLLPQSKRDNPGPRLVFLFAALSKAAASTITYPVSLAKTRAQISRQSSPGIEKQDPAAAPPSLETQDAQPVTRAAKASRYARKAFRIIFNQQLSQLAVLRSLQQIYRSEGFLALYSGLEGEVLKGFLGHGLTMLLKERIHVGIISLYYTLLNLTQRVPGSLGSVRESAANEIGKAKTAIGDVAGDALGKAKEAGSVVQEGAGNAAQSVGALAQDAGERVRNITETVAEGAKHTMIGDKE